MSKVPFIGKKQAKEMWLLKGEKQTFSQSEALTWACCLVHIYARFEEYLLNTSAVITKTSFEQRRILTHLLHSDQKISRYLCLRYTLY